ncbi:MAG: hypothetical protein E7G18_05020 [Anaerococcus hydrogenalis]|uniref:hypothetical protein n=1 Tax=Anaerococcus hydrogenalis TaxID=33029 RepID=UPI00290E066A|nr:hypothetical protein [Anaerococcus hydrogenalis]MDU3688031.1 hypothetical protein [Anaerococcus hydrogenalis]
MKERIIDFLEISKYAFSESVKKIKKSYILFIALIVRSVFEGMKGLSMLNSSYLSSLINYLIEILILCFVAQALRSIVLYNNTGKKSIENSISNFFYLIMSAMFSIYIVELLINNLLSGLDPTILNIVSIIFKFLTSAVIELVYIESVYGFSILIDSFNFVKNNLFIWGIYALIYTLVETYLINKLVMNTLIISNEFIFVILLSIWDTIFLLYKGHLFKILSKHSYGQRKFMRG